MHWTWDPEKDRINQQIHRITFQTATLVFRDPGALLDPDPYPLEQRWRAIGYINGMLVAVTYTLPEGPGVPGRIISARRASREERTDYEEGI